MATFYLLPPRPVVGQVFQAFLSSLFPGLGWQGQHWPDLAESLGQTAAAQPDVYVVYQEDMAENAAQALQRDFGAESGDEVIEVKLAAGKLQESGRWRVPSL